MTRTPARRLLALALATAIAPAWAQQAVDPQAAFAVPQPAAAQAAPEQPFQFERTGYFVADRRDHTPGKPVFNRSVTLRDTWSAG